MTAPVPACPKCGKIIVDQCVFAILDAEQARREAAESNLQVTESERDDLRARLREAEEEIAVLKRQMGEENERALDVLREAEARRDEWKTHCDNEAEAHRLSVEHLGGKLDVAEARLRALERQLEALGYGRTGWPARVRRASLLQVAEARVQALEEALRRILVYARGAGPYHQVASEALRAARDD